MLDRSNEEERPRALLPRRDAYAAAVVTAASWRKVDSRSFSSTPRARKDLLRGRGFEILQDLPEQEERRRPQADEDRQAFGACLLFFLVDLRRADPQRHGSDNGCETEAVQQITTETDALERDRNPHDETPFVALRVGSKAAGTRGRRDQTPHCVDREDVRHVAGDEHDREEKAALDDNPATAPDLTWTPPISAPYSENPSGHLGLDSSHTTVLRMFFGNAPAGGYQITSSFVNPAGRRRARSPASRKRSARSLRHASGGAPLPHSRRASGSARNERRELRSRELLRAVGNH